MLAATVLLCKYKKKITTLKKSIKIFKKHLLETQAVRKTGIVDASFLLFLFLFLADRAT